MKRFLLLIFLALTQVQGVSLKSQVVTDETVLRLPVIGRSDGQEIRLRWAPSDYRVWTAIRRSGLLLERNTIMRDGKVLPAAERTATIQLQAAPINPAPLETFERLGPTNDFIAIGGQAIYGESFSVTAPNDPNDVNIGGLVNLAREQSNRFSFGLYAADQDWEAASLMGLAFRDGDVRPNEVYVYRLRPADGSAAFDTLRSGFVTVAGSPTPAPPPIGELAAEFADRQATISWDTEVAANHYTSYFVERSTDGVRYAVQNDKPFVPLLPAKQPDRTVYYLDTLSENNQPYFFRVAGRTPFGTLGPWSDPVQGMGLDAQPEAGPTMSSIFPAEAGGFLVSWTWDGDESALNGFRLFRAPNIKGPYEAVSDLLPANTRDFEDPAPLSSNYYRVTLYDQYDRELNSYAVLAQLDDVTPPDIPTGLRGVILKDGRVMISWDENTEEDLLGYRIWLSNMPDVEYSLASNQVERDNYFVGRTTLNTLSRELYAKVVSLDLRHNTSDFSDHIVLLRPDTIPPAPPLMTDLIASHDTLLVSWAFSRSPDLERHELQRRAVGEASGDWTVLKTYPAPAAAPTASFVETTTTPGKDYEYRVVAYDLSGLSTPPPRSLRGRRLESMIADGITKVTARPDRRAKTVQLSWEYEPDRAGLSHFIVYRGEATENPVTIARLPAKNATQKGDRFGYVDASLLRMNTPYSYRIRAVYASGAKSPMSPSVAVRY